MNRRHSIRGLAALLLAGCWTAASAGGEAAPEIRDVRSAKPSAPVALRWVRDGREAVVEVEISAAVDHDGVDLRLVVPGGGLAPASSLPAAAAGPAGTVTWELDAPVTAPPRVIVVLRQGGARQAATFVAPGDAGQDVARPDEQRDGMPADGKRSRAGGEAQISAPSIPSPPSQQVEPPGEPEAVHPLPAQETLRRGEPGETAEPE